MSAIDWTNIKKAVQKWVSEGSGIDPKRVIWNFRGGERPQAPWISISIVAIKQPSHDWVSHENFPLSEQITGSSFAVSAVSTVDGKLSVAAHPFVTGDGPVTLHSVGADYPAPWDETTKLWVISDDAGHVQLTDTFQRTGGNHVGNPITPVVPTTTGSQLTIIVGSDAVRAGKEIRRFARGLRAIDFRLQCFGEINGGTQPLEILSDVVASLSLYVYELDLAGVGMSSLGVADIEDGVKMVEGRRGGILEPRSVVEMSMYVGSEVVGYIGSIERVQVTPIVQLEDGDEVTLPSEWVPE